MNLASNAIIERLRDWSFRAKEIGPFIKGLQLSPLVLVLMGLSAFFFCDIVYELLAPPTEFTLPKAPPLKPIKASLPVKPFMPPPIETFAAIDDRPMFFPSRHSKAKPADEAAAQALQPPNIALIGVILNGATRIAITRAPNATAAVDLVPGQSIDGWEVGAIEADHIELRANGTTAELKLQPPSASQAPGAQVVPQSPLFEPSPSPSH